MNKYLTGVVVANKAADTAVVEVTTWKIHRIFKKRYKRTSRYLVHNPGNLIEVGARVEVIPTRPISKRKFWRISPIVEVEPSDKPKKSVSKKVSKKESK